MKERKNAGRARRRGSDSGKLNNTIRRKLAGLFIGVVLALILVLLRITYINAAKGDQYAQQVLSTSQSQYASVTLPYKRGDILDANGTVLATSEKTYNVILDCKAVNTKAEYNEPTIAALTQVFGIDEEKIRNLLSGETTKTSMYQVLLKNISIEDKQAYDDYMDGTEDDPLTKEEREDRANVKGIWFEEEYVRNYPLGSTACDVIGFVYDTNQADWGIEGYYNNTLNGVDGRKYGYWDSDSDLGQTIVEPVDGDTVKSTIDVNIQKVCEKYIALFKDYYADGPYDLPDGAANIGVVVMDPNDGSVLAMASNGPYDLNDPRDLTLFYTQEEIDGMSEERQLENLNEIWRNYCISDTFEPGSTFKPITMAAALEDATLLGDETLVCDGSQTVAGTTIKCWVTEGHGEETLEQVMANSCNDGLMQIAASMGSDEFCKYQALFNFGSRTGIDLSGEAAGIVRTASTMGEVDLATAAFGQGFTCTMLQECAAMCSIVNGGYYYKPHVISSVLDSDGNIKKSYDKVLVRQTISGAVSDVLRAQLKYTVEHGTASSAYLDGYSMGGKTGTAQKIPRGNGKYLVSFAGFVPYENPQVVIYVIVDEPNVEEEVSSVYAQWIGRDILQEILPYMGIYRDQETDPDHWSLKYDFTNVEGKSVSQIEEEINAEQEEGIEGPVVESVADTGVPTPQGTEDEENIAGGNNEETDGVTNEEAGFTDEDGEE